MWRVLGSEKRLCTGCTRRDFLEIGGASVAGISLTNLLASSAARAATAEARARNCIILFLYGSPSQLETFDMKPQAPVEIRGEMQPIPSRLPGVPVCEYLPHTAQIMDRVTVIRSMSHPYPIHGVAYAMTGVPIIDVNMELSPHDPRHQPYFGCVVDYHLRQQSPPRSVPYHVALPFPFSSQRTGEVYRAGPYAAYLGSTYNPIWTEFHGKATRHVVKTLGSTELEVHDPYLGCTPDSYFQLSATSLPSGITLDRLNRRHSLLQQFELERRRWEQTAAGQSWNRFQELAFQLLNSRQVAAALDVRSEPASVRELYGHTLFGQACLAARRLVEVGTRVVSVFWDEYGLAGDAWDTHWNHFPRMKEQLLPPFDRAFSGLIRDLDDRGLLDETVVVCVSEHGRTPRLNSARGGGRDHWSQAYCAVLAGGGVARGRVVGATDRHAAEVTSNPVSPKDLLATLYHLLGIDPHHMLRDRTGRTIPLVPDEARVLHEVLS